VNTWRDALLVAAGGASGTLLRWAATIAARHIGLAAPGIIFLVNVSGCFAFGLLHGFCLARHEAWRLALLTGLLGGYTTFSTFGWDTFQLIQSGRPLAAFANAAASIAAGPAAAWLGWLLASRQH
jgi:CrcB protein